MKVFQVVHEEDEGESFKDGHKSVVKLRKVSTFYAALDIEFVLQHLLEHNGPEKVIISVSEVIPSLRILE